MPCCVGLLSWCYMLPFDLQTDEKMNEVMDLAHTFLQNFCRGNPQNQVLLHKHLNLFLTPGVSTTKAPNTYTYSRARVGLPQLEQNPSGLHALFPLIVIHPIRMSVSIEKIL